MKDPDSPVPATDEDEIGRLIEEIAWSLHRGQVEQAARVVARLLELAPDSTTTQELHGDVLRAQGKPREARNAYRRSLEIEPANADAERKYAELILRTEEQDWQREALLTGDFSRLRQAGEGNPRGAAARSMLFPGLGQLYNGDYELGVGLAALGFLLLGAVLVYFVVPLMDMLVRAVARTPGADTVSVWGWLALVGLAAVYTYSAWEAYRSASSQSR